MIRLAISVEGQTEEVFVHEVLREHLSPKMVIPHPMLIGRSMGGEGGGGDVTTRRLVNDMVQWHYTFDAVTSLVDYYGFRDKGDRTVEALEQHLSQEIEKRIPNAWPVFPYVQKHEFEGLLFSHVEAFRAVGVTDRVISDLAAVRHRFLTPEDINDDRNTAPSKRLERTIPKYDKPVHGPLVARTIGLDVIRRQCPRFHAWLSRLETLAHHNRN